MIEICSWNFYEDCNFDECYQLKYPWSYQQNYFEESAVEINVGLFISLFFYGGYMYEFLELYWSYQLESQYNSKLILFWSIRCNFFFDFLGCYQLIYFVILSNLGCYQLIFIGCYQINLLGCMKKFGSWSYQLIFLALWNFFIKLSFTNYMVRWNYYRVFM